MKIGTYLTLVILTALIGGVILAGYAFSEYKKLKKFEDESNEEQLLQKDIYRINDGISIILLNTDQILGSDNDFIIHPALEQFDALVNLTETNLNLLKNAGPLTETQYERWKPWLEKLVNQNVHVQSGESSPVSFIQETVEYIEKSNLQANRKSILRYELGKIRKELLEIRKVVTVSTELDATNRIQKLHKLYAKSLNSSDRLLASSDQITAFVNTMVLYSNQHRPRTYKDLSINLGLAGAFYLTAIFLTWAWCQREISTPLKSLNELAKLASEQNVPFDLNATGPKEVLELEHSIYLFVTSLEAARDAALQTSRLKSDFIANMSHELRTPLNAIIGYSEMLIEDTRNTDNKDLRNDLMKIEGAGKHLLSLISGVLDFSKIEAGKMEIFEETFSVCDMISNVESTIQPLVAKNVNTLRVIVSDSVTTMHADLTKMRQILFNLLGNAAKFTSDDEILLQVELERRLDSDWILFSVVDNGIGMTEDQTSCLFEKFTQADSSTTRKYGGTGLGLALCWQYTEMMGGELHVESQRNIGTTFKLALPSKIEILPDPQSRDDPNPSVPTDTIMIIDEDESVHELFQDHLTAMGFHVSSIFDGSQGIRIAKQNRPSMIILDVMMPGMDGWNLLNQIKNDPELENIPVIMLTLTENKNRGYAMGVSGYLQKPVSKSDLANLVDTYFASTPSPDVLVVDDDPDMRDLLRGHLHRLNCSVRESENGLAAIKSYRQSVPDLIILDLMMPEMDGFEFVDYIRENFEEQPPIVVMTAKEVTHDDRTRLQGAIEILLAKDNFRKQKIESVVEWLLCDWRIKLKKSAAHHA